MTKQEQKNLNDKLINAVENENLKDIKNLIV